MKIFTTAMDEFDAFRRFFQGHQVELLPKNYKGMTFDLLLFPGGSDVHPKRYGGKIPPNSIYSGWIDEERDEWEFGLVQDIIKGTFAPTKVLGVCRGMQLLNVSLHGNLVYDITTRWGHPHPHVHPISWQYENLFSSITEVNSIHHQGIYSLGDFLTPRILGIEPTTGISEAILWGDIMLGVQFHPELWGNMTGMKILSQGILDWITGKSFVVDAEKDKLRVSYKKLKADWNSTPSVQSAWVAEYLTPEINPEESDDFDEEDDEDEG